MEVPSWVSEGSERKYHRAIVELKKAGKEVTEQAIYELYVRDHGLVIGEGPKSEVKKAKKAE